MTLILEAETRFEAWMNATEILLSQGDQLNMILDIARPNRELEAGKLARSLVDALYLNEKQLPMHSVAETIFPAWKYIHYGAEGVYSRYPTEFEQLHRKRPQQWGTYAYRLVRRTCLDGTIINPLENLVRKMKRSLRGGSIKYRSCYEIGMSDDCFDLPIYSDISDANRLRALPCLMHLSFKLVGNQVHLTALYRNHDYRYKVPGNLLGLARLQDFVAKEVGVGVGGLVVHSTFAYVDSGNGKKQFKELLERIKGDAPFEEN